MSKKSASVRLGVASLWLVLLSGCTTSLNAGDHGGIAWILMSIMLLVIGAVLWIIIGRED